MMKERKSMEKKVRNPYFDNAKFLLIFLVIFGHILQSFIKKSEPTLELYTLIYTFHMPAFIFISGYFSKSFSQNPGEKIRENFGKFIIPYMFFQWIYAYYFYLIDYREKFAFQLHVPHWALWFLISSFLWYVSLLIFYKLPAIIGIPLSFILSMLVGYSDFFGKEFSLHRTFVFLPFFVIGYYFSPKIVDWFINFKYRYIFAIGFVVNYVITIKVLKINRQAFFGVKPYISYMNHPENGALLRLLVIALALISMVAFFAIVPKTKRFYTELGKYTITGYLLQGFVIRYLRMYKFKELTYDWKMFVLLTIFSILLTLVLTSPPVGRAYNRVFNKILGTESKPAKKSK